MFSPLVGYYLSLDLAYSEVIGSRVIRTARLQRRAISRLLLLLETAAGGRTGARSAGLAELDILLETSATSWLVMDRTGSLL